MDGLFSLRLICFQIYLRCMQSIKWLGVLTAAIIITACFFKWISVDQNDYFIGGFYSSDNRYGQPGIFHTIFCLIYILLILINRIWSIRTAFFVAALNVAWAVRNFLMLSTCVGGECPEKHTGLYSVLVGSLLLLVLTPFIKVSSK